MRSAVTPQLQVLDRIWLNRCCMVRN